MKLLTGTSLAAGVIGALCLVSPVSVFAADAAPPATAPAPAAAATPTPAAAQPAKTAEAAPAKVAARTTLEQQVEYLEDALGEGLGTLDWKMASLAADGFKTAGLTGKDLELSILRSERSALIDHAGSGAQVVALGMTVRAEIGDAQALATLQSWARDEIPAVKPPDQNQWKDAPAEAVKAQKAYTDYQHAVSRREYSILGLALLKQPGVVDQAIAALRSATADQGGGGFGGGGGPFGFAGRGRSMFTRGGGNTQPLVLAALAADPQAGLKALLDYCSDDKIELSQQASVLQALARIAPGTKQRQGPDTQFTLESDIGAKLPADTFAQLAKPYVAMVKRWKPDDGNANYRSMGVLMELLSAGNDFPEKSIDADGITALQQLKDLIPGQQGQWLRPQVDSVLKRQGADPSAPTKPPAPPKDF